MKTYKQFLKEQSNIYYRGIEGEFDTKIAKSKRVTWITKNKDYAIEYSDGKHLIKYNAIIKNPFDFGFRTLQVYVNLKEMLSRIMVKLNDDYGSKISKKKADMIYDKIDDFKSKYKSKLSGMKKVWEFWQQYPELIEIIKLMGYDSIVAKEGISDSIETYGVFSQNQLKKIN